MDNLVIAVGGVAAMVVCMLPFYLRHRRVERRFAEAAAKARQRGLHEPVSLHPVVDIEACIGSESCLSVCPEGDVLGFRDGQAYAIAPASCIGHGLCERACPTEAIRLVLGTETRGVELPRIQQNFETNVPGIYVIGELGGMGLIRNAFEQGRRCVEGIAKSVPRGPADALDVVIVGCGPAGLSAALHCLHRGMRFQTIDKEDIGGTVRHYPRKKIVMTSPVTVPGYGKLNFREIAKERLIETWEDIVAKAGLQVNTSETVEQVSPTDDAAFIVRTDKGSYKTKRVILAIGKRGVPRKLNVPGEDMPKVIYSLREPEAFENDRIVVVGGGDSAVEAALALSEQRGNQVTMSYRKHQFVRIKERNRERITNAIAGGRVTALWSTNVLEIHPDQVIYADETGTAHGLANDVVCIFAGGEMPTKFLQACGIEMDMKFGEPV